MIRREDISEIGKFQKTHGLAGELNAVFDIEPEELRADIPMVIDIDGIFVPFYIESIRGKGHFSSLVKLAGVDNVDEAKPFVNKLVYIRKEDMIEIANEDEDGFYADDLVGFEIDDCANGQKRVGVIENLDLSSENALFIVKDQNGRIVYIPAADELIERIDVDHKKLFMHLPEGLIELNK